MTLLVHSKEFEYILYYPNPQLFDLGFEDYDYADLEEPSPVAIQLPGFAGPDAFGDVDVEGNIYSSSIIMLSIIFVTTYNSLLIFVHLTEVSQLSARSSVSDAFAEDVDCFPFFLILQISYFYFRTVVIY